MTEVGILTGITILVVWLVIRLWRSLRGPGRTRARAVTRVIGVCIVIMALGAYSAWRLSKSRSFQLFGGMVDHVETLQPAVALTFDDGPVPGYTEEVLAILHEEGVRATFFVVGQSAGQNMDQAQQIVA
ncbi:MAG: polysaccharide deacetylase family protein, partial [Anaerolineae bacterium]|nr:polysaccharide deacetylase family protein [Anaerolineae bacterium]